MVVQSPTQLCQCGKEITFPDGQVQTKCQNKYCRATWTLGTEGFWAITNIPVASGFAKMKEKRKERYEAMVAQRKADKR